MLVLLDAVHGRIINGEYQTPGKRSSVWSDGAQLFEGKCNRWLVNGIAEQFSSKNIAYVLISPEQCVVSLKTRGEQANKYAAQDCIYVSVNPKAGGKGF
jgi:N-acetylmuramoyl-L-alanine amidase